jgi:hypothetical protein
MVKVKITNGIKRLPVKVELNGKQCAEQEKSLYNSYEKTILELMNMQESI